MATIKKVEPDLLGNIFLNVVIIFKQRYLLVLLNYNLKISINRAVNGPNPYVSKKLKIILRLDKIRLDLFTRLVN